ncbi:uncharacterized protein LOC132742907 [Ruditapes philippinarum]|uniref:uncharacterized protein LOC132742907 n=1 Tax=Ruditapes philippinarum TaxID=129788 RepID=UPI00295B6008|nr:uncharacterized protein LOC132742907 [Ruditapes philippinarum]
MYKRVTSYVKYQGIKSDSFPVLQGTRQGGKSSPLFYLLFIDGLIKELEKCGYGFCVYDLNVSTPTVADDMVLVSLSKCGMDKMLDICSNYSRQWRYNYNVIKCGIIVYNERDTESKDNREFKLGNEVIKETKSYKHLGIETEKTLNTKKPIFDAGNKLRGTLLSIHNNGINPQLFKPNHLKNYLLLCCHSSCIVWL